MLDRCRGLRTRCAAAGATGATGSVTARNADDSATATKASYGRRASDLDAFSEIGSVVGSAVTGEEAIVAKILFTDLPVPPLPSRQKTINQSTNQSLTHDIASSCHRCLLARRRLLNQSIVQSIMA